VNLTTRNITNDYTSHFPSNKPPQLNLNNNNNATIEVSESETTTK